MLMEDASPPCATSCTWPGPKAAASPTASRRRASRRPLGTRYCSSRLPSATANEPEDPPWSCQSVSWPRSQASSQTSQELDRCSGRYQRTSGSCTTRSAHSSRWPASATVMARSWAGDRRPLPGTRPRMVSTIACWRSGLTPQPGLSPDPPDLTVATDTRPPHLELRLYLGLQQHYAAHFPGEPEGPLMTPPSLVAPALLRRFSLLSPGGAGPLRLAWLTEYRSVCQALDV